jgi:phospholipid-transporting ATPase
LDELVYNAASPDERALVEGAQKFGYIFLSRTPTTVLISIQGEERTYDVLNLIEFTSTRKRMTVILKCPDGKIRLYCKGADSVILERITTKSSREEAELRATQEHLDFFASEGLRTLCVAMKILSESEHHEWNLGFQNAVTTIHDREEEVNASAELMENGLTLLGSTAIEDKLQDLVPETIAAFLEAGISVWVLTGG